MSPNAPARAARSMCARAGFTLIELMVVVAIIGLLVSLLIPALVGVREKARLVVCGSNLHNIAFAWHAYLKDNHDRLPRGKYNIHTTYGGKQGQARGYGGPSDDPEPPSADPVAIPRVLNRYLGLPPIMGAYPPGSINKPGEAPTMPVSENVKVFHCPGDTGSFILPVDATVYSTRFDYYGTSYHTNRYVIGPIPPLNQPIDPCRLGLDIVKNRFENYTVPAISNESRLILIGDYGFDDWQNPNQSGNLEFHARTYRASSAEPLPYAPSRHNVAFLDGHVGFVPIRKGIYVCSDYTVIPFRDLQQIFTEYQQSGPFQ